MMRCTMWRNHPRMKRKRASGAWCWTMRRASLQEMMQYQCGQFRSRKAKPQVALD